MVSIRQINFTAFAQLSWWTPIYINRVLKTDLKKLFRKTGRSRCNWPIVALMKILIGSHIIHHIANRRQLQWEGQLIPVWQFVLLAQLSDMKYSASLTRRHHYKNTYKYRPTVCLWKLPSTSILNYCDHIYFDTYNIACHPPNISVNYALCICREDYNMIEF